MGHGLFGSGHDNYRSDRLSGGIKRLPRSLKIAVIIIILFVLLIIALGAVLLLLLLIKLLNGGSLPSLLQSAQDFIQSKVGPLLNLWDNVQNIIGN